MSLGLIIEKRAVLRLRSRVFLKPVFQSLLQSPFNSGVLGKLPVCDPRPRVSFNQSDAVFACIRNELPTDFKTNDALHRNFFTTEISSCKTMWNLQAGPFENCKRSS